MHHDIRHRSALGLLILITGLQSHAADAPSEPWARDAYAENGGVRIHYATAGRGPLVVLVHGFPDFWYTWRHQFSVLTNDYQLAAMDLRGYNLSDKPAGVENYDLKLVVEDVAAVVRHAGREKAIIIGHDWGGAVSWNFAMTHPEMTERLIILNLPHPRGFMHELATNPRQQANSSYARSFQKEGAHEKLTAEALSGWVKDPEARAKYLEAFRRSNFESMLNYYKRNYPREPYAEPSAPFPKVACPVLMIHGLDDQALLAGALNNTWDWLGADLTLVTIPGAGHFVQHDATELVNRSIKSWLHR
jgi:pimeloyl-ACP methyl ester carboxylesterase